MVQGDYLKDLTIQGSELELFASLHHVASMLAWQVRNADGAAVSWLNTTEMLALNAGKNPLSDWNAYVSPACPICSGQH